MELIEYIDLLEDAWHGDEPCILTASQSKELADHCKEMAQKVHRMEVAESRIEEYGD